MLDYRMVFQFPSDYQFSEFRLAVNAAYEKTAVEVTRTASYRDGKTKAEVRCMRGLGAEIKAIAAGYLAEQVESCCKTFSD